MGYETLTKAGMRGNAHATLFKLIDDNKPSGWTVLSHLPNSEVQFPCILVNAFMNNPFGFTADRSIGRYKLGLKVEFIVLEGSGEQKIDEGKDSVQNTILSNFIVLKGYGLELDESTPFTDEEIGMDSFREQTVLSSAINVNFERIGSG